MISLSECLALVILIALSLYLLMGGADFGGGIWSLFASGPNKKAQRDLVAKAIAPVWEANHVWLILALVLMFTAFPKAFYAVATQLYLPLSILLVGIVVRGAAFIFHSYGPEHSPIWSRLFAATSLLAPFCLGWCWGFVRSGKGFLTLEVLGSAVCVVALCAYLAAVYLTGETKDPELRAVFQNRAKWLGNPISLVVLIVAPADIPQAMRMLVFLFGFGAFRANQANKPRPARWLAAATVFSLCLGWGIAQYPFLVYPDISIANSAASQTTLKYLLVTLAGGALVLFPSLYGLFRIFK